MITYLGIPGDLLGAGLVLGHIIKYNASVHLTTATDIQRSGRITMECGLVAEHYKTPYFRSWHRRPPSWKKLAEKGSIKTCETYRQRTTHLFTKTQTSHNCCSKHSLPFCKFSVTLLNSGKFSFVQNKLTMKVSWRCFYTKVRNISKFRCYTRDIFIKNYPHHCFNL